MFSLCIRSSRNLLITYEFQDIPSNLCHAREVSDKISYLVRGRRLI